MLTGAAFLNGGVDVLHFRILPRSLVVYRPLATEFLPAGVIFLTGNGEAQTRMSITSVSRPGTRSSTGDLLLVRLRYGCKSYPYPAREPSRLAATASLTGGVGDTVCRGCSYTRMCFTSTSYGYETHPYPAREPSRLAATASLTGGVGDTPSRLAATASLTGGVGDTVCRGCSYTRMCFTSTSYGYEHMPESQVVWQRPPPSPAALVIRCAGDALIHGCVLHPHPTDMKHIRILPESQVVWQRPPPLTGGVGDTVCRRCSYTDVLCIHILPGLPVTCDRVPIPPAWLSSLAKLTFAHPAFPTGGVGV
ncbi:hypothetical protein BT96DRAFT_950401 [Gymnopus androsaceus JB14]|uniref:Uncharacterized protein n=1 Tax=Gymnopus androsaceus JB14 TaxID=1447944 RepID=A0A6A4GH13_9AGAR|nr:hypothetical protein BT96DRAFT_950401 [Gymnopus androsaceus JB14]